MRLCTRMIIRVFVSRVADDLIYTEADESLVQDVITLVN